MSAAAPLPDGLAAALAGFAAGRAALAATPRVAPLPGGLVNRSWRVTTDAADWVVRLGGDGAAHALDRAAEAVAVRAAAAAGYAPRVVHAAGAVLVLEHVAGRVWSFADAQAPRGLRLVGARLRGLHALPLAPGLRTVAADAAIARYLAAPPPDGGPLPRARLAARAARVLAAYVPGGVAFCHHDLHHLNVVEPASAPPLFLDWEYAGAGDPWLDLAAYCAYHDLDAEARRTLLDAYGAADGDAPRRLDVAVAAFDCLQALWFDAADGWGALPPDRREALLARLGDAPR